MSSEKSCEQCASEDDYLAFHRFPEKKRECGKCIADRVLESAMIQFKQQQEEE